MVLCGFLKMKIAANSAYFAFSTMQDHTKSVHVSSIPRCNKGEFILVPACFPTKGKLLNTTLLALGLPVMSDTRHR